MLFTSRGQNRQVGFRGGKKKAGGFSCVGRCVCVFVCVFVCVCVCVCNIIFMYPYAAWFINICVYMYEWETVWRATLSSVSLLTLHPLYYFATAIAQRWTLCPLYYWRYAHFTTLRQQLHKDGTRVLEGGSFMEAFEASEPPGAGANLNPKP